MIEKAKIKQFIKQKFGSLRNFCRDAGLVYATEMNNSRWERYVVLANETQPTRLKIRKGFSRDLSAALAAKGSSLRGLCIDLGIDPVKAANALRRGSAYPSPFASLVIEAAKAKGVEIDFISITKPYYRTYEQYTEAKEALTTELAVGAEDKGVCVTEPE